MATGFEFCDSGLCEVPKAEEREKKWVSYERGGIVVDARSTNVQRSTLKFFSLALHPLWETRSRYTT